MIIAQMPKINLSMLPPPNRISDVESSSQRDNNKCHVINFVALLRDRQQLLDLFVIQALYHELAPPLPAYRKP